MKARLRPFHTAVKREIEGFGGTLDKFIGDAGLGVFGSPVAHEDDPERAVRAALAIKDAIARLNEADPRLGLAVRQGIDTGEAVVAFGTGPQIGETVTGDVVNTASRLQGAAPVNGIAVGEETYEATLWLALIECDVADHKAELRHARRLVALQPRNPNSWGALRRAARCNGR